MTERVTSVCVCVCVIGIARGGHGKALGLPSLNIALPSKPSFYLNCILGSYTIDSFITYLEL